MSFNARYPYDLSHLPPKVNFKDPKLLDLVIKARSELGELKGYSFSLPNPLLLLSPAIIKESLASSEVENINTTMIDVLENQIFLEEERRKPDKEVLRYRDAVIWGFKKLDENSISTRLITGVQDELFPKESMGYRRHQNAIKNYTRKKIVYTPPVQARISEYMSNLEGFVNEVGEAIDPLIRCAISHYQFEAIHPFKDGNGRTGRILMVLQLVKSKILSLPILYISGYINQNKNEYYRRLLEVTMEKKWQEYIEFMLKGFYYQAKDTKDMIFRIMKLFYEIKEEVKKNEHKIYSADLVEALFSYPVISPVKLGEKLDCHYTTASKYLRILEEMGILMSKKIGRYHLFANKELIKILH